MTIKALDEQRRHDVVLLKCQGMSQRAMARALGMSRKSVRKLLEQHTELREKPHVQLQPGSQRSPRPSKLDPHRDTIEGLLQEASLLARTDHADGQLAKGAVVLTHRVGQRTS